ncbi:lysis protein [Pseudomonas palleroniana]|uniref:Lysis protein n=1 Tax=Pseudomonas palleroniana TaxID=191390 RepID=A0A1H5NUC5_9PSED|nr:lysis system i-spanin subunit Rz [Pseudomonas palleroniana]KAB0568934.1 lysis protein [Pseudomonas palleroniana]PTC22376.1 lysis protein [Pseudomonas palleroniana]SEF05269.1 Bacteriophage Rz lysis protein [Pseudomonas palleroniana]
MRLFDLIPAQFRIAAINLLLVVVVTGSAVLAWTAQDWHYGRVLERQARLQADTLNEISQASAALQRTEQDKRLALELRLKNKDETHYKELADEQSKQARLRNRLATADLRLSVVLAATETTGSSAMPTTTATGRVLHGTTRAQLDPVHAQRIIGITDAGDQGLIALKACQAYVIDDNSLGSPMITLV